MDGKKRNLERKINSLLDMFPVVVILGVRQCGKSTLAKMVRKDWKYFDLEDFQDFTRINDDPTLFFEENSENIIIDEAQKSPRLFETLRGVIDKKRNKRGRFILTGSASFELIKHISESLTGRVATINLSPFCTNEFLEQPLSPFYSIFEKKLSSKNLTDLKKLSIKKSYEQLKQNFLKGGYPEPVLRDNEIFYGEWMQNYFEQYINRDMRSLYPKLNIIKYRRVVSMLSTLSGTIINKAEIAKSVEISEKAVKDYMDILSGTFFWRNIPAYKTPKIKTTSKLPKGIFIDSGLALFLQQIYTMEDLDRFSSLGRYFESFIVEELIRGITATSAYNVKFYHLRTKAGGEIDLIVEGSFGLIPIEIKYGSTTPKNKLKFLESFIELHDLPLGIVVNNSRRVEMITSKIIQIPAGAI